MPILTRGEARERFMPESKSFRKESVPIPRQTPARTANNKPFEVTKNFLTGKLKKSRIIRAGKIETIDKIIIPKKSFILPAILLMKKSRPA